MNTSSPDPIRNRMQAQIEENKPAIANDLFRNIAKYRLQSRNSLA